MKKRFNIALILFLIQSMTFLILGLTLKSDLSGAFLMGFFIVSFYLVIYFIGGISKLFVYSIYGIGLFLLMYFFKQYRFAFIIIGTFTLLLNPLGYLENKLARLLDNPDPIELQQLVKRSYFPYYDYRAKMKEYYHLPDVKKLYQDKKYYYLINLTTLILAGIGIFLSLYELNNMAADIAQFRLESILVSYIVIIIFVAALILYKKHFRSALKFLSTTFLIPVVLIVFMTNLPLAWKGAISTASLLGTILILGWQIYQYFQRVVYHGSSYIDTNTNYEVNANVLYEPYMFNESFITVGVYEINVESEVFEKYFKKILAYANFKLFFISAYINTGSKYIVYTQFHKKHKKRPYTFAKYLEKLFKIHVSFEIIADPTHEIYEKRFYQTDDYIVARAVSFGKLMKRLELQSPLIISIFLYFDNTVSLKEFVDIYPVDIVSLDENVITVKIEFEIANVEYLIDLKIREILLNTLIYSGNYIRITAAWRGNQL